MKNIKFENRAVAFIDVLGFSSLVKMAENDKDTLEKLSKLILTLENSIPTLNKEIDPRISRKLIPKHIYISDSIILSAPLTSKKVPSYQGLSVLIMRVIQIAHILLSHGYLIRGGISIGHVWHTGSNIIGPAYQEAYELETKTCVPRVVLSQTAKDLWLSTEGPYNFMCLEYNGQFMANLLHDYYIHNSSNETVEHTFNRYTEIIQKNIDEINSESAKYKWWWFMQFLNNETKRNKYIIHK